jgi:hypothetical protein
MRKTIFYNSNPVAISSKMNEYMKSNFGYEVDGDLESLREAKAQLEAQKREMTADHQDRAYVENMLMIETIKSLLKAHVAEGELPAGLKAYQDAKKKGKSPKKSKAKSDKMPMDAGKDGKMGTKDDKPSFLKKDESLSEYTNENKMEAVCKDCGDTFGKPTTDCKNDCNDPTLDCWVKESSYKTYKEAKDTTDVDHVAEGFKIRDKSRGYGVSDKTYKTRKEAKDAAVMKSASSGGEWEVIEEKVATEGKYKSDAQRKAVHASKAEKANEGETPKFDTMKKYGNTYEAPKEYKMEREKLEEGLLAQLNTLLESDAAEAEVMMAARGMVDELQDMIEKLGKLQNDQLGPLSDEMAYSHGADQASSFKDKVNDAVASLLGQARATKDTVNDAVLVLNGEKPADDMSSGDVIGGDMADDFEDDVEFAAGDEAASGPDDEPLGRAKRS